MAFRYQGPARRRAAVAALIGVIIIVVLGPELTVPAAALVALVYYAHQLAAVLAGDEMVPYPSLAFVIVVNCLVVLLVQLLVFVEGVGVST
jgi:hypothetical protein